MHSGLKAARHRQMRLFRSAGRGALGRRVCAMGGALPRHNGGGQEAAGRKKEKNQGGDSAWDPPLPIPNREVKPRRADGTAKVGE